MRLIEEKMDSLPKTKRGMNVANPATKVNVPKESENTEVPDTPDEVDDEVDGSSPASTEASNCRKSRNTAAAKTPSSTSSRAHMDMVEHVKKLIMIQKIRHICPPELKLGNFDEMFTPDMTYDELVEFYRRFKSLG